MSDRQLRSRVQSGFLDKTGARTYRSPLTPTSRRTELVALLLDIGEPCWASGPTAAAVLGFDGFKLKPPFHVTVLRGRHIERTGVKVHTTTDLPLIDRAVVDGIPVLSGARCVIEFRVGARGKRSPWRTTADCATGDSTRTSSTVDSLRCVRRVATAHL